MINIEAMSMAVYPPTNKMVMDLPIPPLSRLACAKAFNADEVDR